MADTVPPALAHLVGPVADEVHRARKVNAGVGEQVRTAKSPVHPAIPSPRVARRSRPLVRSTRGPRPASSAAFFRRRLGIGAVELADELPNQRELDRFVVPTGAPRRDADTRLGTRRAAKADQIDPRL